MRQVRLGAVAEINALTVPENTAPDQEILYADLAAVNLMTQEVLPRVVRFEEAPSRARRRARAGDSLLPYLTGGADWQTTRPLLLSANQAGVVFSTGFYTATPQLIEARFLNYALASRPALSYLDAHSSGVTMKGFSQEAFSKLPISLPEPRHQTAIADFLDTETARIDALISKKRQMIDLLDEQRLAHCAHHLLPKGEVLPESWEWRRVRHICPEVTVGVVVDPSSYFTPEGVPFIHGTDVHRGWIDESRFKYLSPTDNAKLFKSQVRAGDVVAMRVGEPGRAAVVPPHLDRSNCASVLIFRRSDRLASDLLAAFLNSSVGRSQIEAMQYGAAQGVLNVAHARELRVPVPPVDAQRAITARLRHVDQVQHRARRGLVSQITLLREHRQALITAAVTGELEVPGVAA